MNCEIKRAVQGHWQFHVLCSCCFCRKLEISSGRFARFADGAAVVQVQKVFFDLSSPFLFASLCIVSISDSVYYQSSFCCGNSLNTRHNFVGKRSLLENSKAWAINMQRIVTYAQESHQERKSFQLVAAGLLVWLCVPCPFYLGRVSTAQQNLYWGLYCSCSYVQLVIHLWGCLLKQSKDDLWFFLNVVLQV